jgi:hypothetical protein
MPAGGGQNPRGGPKRPIKPQFAKGQAVLQRILRNRADGGHQSQDDRQIEMGAVFGQIGRRQMGDHPAGRSNQPN